MKSARSNLASRLAMALSLFAVVALFVALADPRVRGLTLNTLYLVGGVISIALPIGFFLAVMLFRTDLPGRRALTVALLLLLFMPVYLQAAAWQAGFGQQGSLVPAMGGRTLIEGWPATIWIHAVAALPWAVLFSAAALLSSERALEEQALLDMPALRVFWRVTLPRCVPSLLAAAVWIAVLTSGDMTVTNLFQIRTFAEELYTQLSLGEGLGQIVLTGLPAWVFTALLVAAGAIAVDRFLVAAKARQRQPLRFSLGTWRGVSTAIVWAVVLLFVAVPIFSLLSKAGLVVTAGEGGQRIRSWSALRCFDLIVTSPARFARELSWSFLLASIAATVATLAAIVLVWGTRQQRAGRFVVLCAVGFALALPGPVVGLALIQLLNAPGRPVLNWLYDQTVFAPCVAMGVRAFAVATLIVWFTLGRLPRELFEIASLDGMPRHAQLRRIALPLGWRGFAAAWIAAWSVALADLSASILVLPPGVDTIALRLFERLHYGAEDQVAGVSLMLVIVFAALGYTTLALLRSPGEHIDPSSSPG